MHLYIVHRPRAVVHLALEVAQCLPLFRECFRVQPDDDLPMLQHDESFAQEIEALRGGLDPRLVLHRQAEPREVRADQIPRPLDDRPVVVEDEEVVVIPDIKICEGVNLMVELVQQRDLV